MKQVIASILVFVVIALGFLVLAKWPILKPGARVSQVALCKEHGLPPATCPFCNPSLVEKGGICEEHGVPEALCTKCNPLLIPAFQKSGDWCKEHGVPESQCFLCNPDLAKKWKKPEKALKQVSSSIVLEEIPRSLRRPNPGCAKERLRIRFASLDTAEEAGIVAVPVERKDVTETVSCNGQVSFDLNRMTKVSSRVGGILREIRKHPGDYVSAGETVAIVDCPDVARYRGEYLEARERLRYLSREGERQKALFKEEITSGRALQEALSREKEARIHLDSVRQQLLLLGLSAAQVKALEGKNSFSARVPVVSTSGGIVVERLASQGETVEIGRPLLSLAELSTMWVNLDVRESDLPRVAEGQRVSFQVDGMPGRTFFGVVTRISPQADRRTRTLKVRAEMENRDGLLRDGMYGKGIIRIREEGPVVLVPRESVQWEGCCNVVFEQLREDLYVPRKVTLRGEAGNYLIVERGIRPGARIATQGSFLLKTEILKGSIGAGCCDVEER
ncbi:MAG: efflux RND transporter periplasmic adaptor subunit [Armatimonadetes bacterium]|nr:efflux RND transporter periplasmic adaptor subunit [Armatimonadota bacterium]